MSATIVPTAEQLDVLTREAATVLMVDSRGVPTHVVLPIDDARRVFEEYLKRELAVAFDEADRGIVEPWDVEATIAEARSRHG